MIHANINRNHYYKSLEKKIAICLDKAIQLDKDTPCGRYELGENLFVNVCEYEPKPLGDEISETHSIYADIQLILDGDEFIGYSETDLLDPICKYDEEKDIRFWKGPVALLPMRTGDWVLFLPGEPHAPSLKMNARKVKKAVFKFIPDKK